MEAAGGPRRRKISHLGLSCDFHLQTRRALFSVRSRLGPAVSHLLSQIRYWDVPHWRYPQPRVPSIFPGHTRRTIPTDICLRSQAYEKAGWIMDETTATLSVHPATKVCISKFLAFTYYRSIELFDFTLQYICHVIWFALRIENIRSNSNMRLRTALRSGLFTNNIAMKLYFNIWVAIDQRELLFTLIAN